MKSSEKWCWIISGVFVLAFAITCLMDWVSKAPSSSAPYWAFMLARAIEFLIPALLFGIAAIVIRLKGNRTVS